MNISDELFPAIDKNGNILEFIPNAGNLHYMTHRPTLEFNMLFSRKFGKTAKIKESERYTQEIFVGENYGFKIESTLKLHRRVELFIYVSSDFLPKDPDRKIKIDQFIEERAAWFWSYGKRAFSENLESRRT